MYARMIVEKRSLRTKILKLHSLIRKKSFISFFVFYDFILLHYASNSYNLNDPRCRRDLSGINSPLLLLANRCLFSIFHLVYQHRHLNNRTITYAAYLCLISAFQTGIRVQTPRAINFFTNIIRGNKQRIIFIFSGRRYQFIYIVRAFSGGIFYFHSAFYIYVISRVETFSLSSSFNFSVFKFIEPFD